MTIMFAIDNAYFLSKKSTTYDEIGNNALEVLVGNNYCGIIISLIISWGKL